MTGNQCFNGEDCIVHAVRRHGTRQRYISRTHPCRCEPCREANRQYTEDLYGSDAHGTHKRYKAGCRCDDCKKSNTAKRQAERDAKRRAALARSAPTATWTGPASQATRIQKPAGWPETVWRGLERAS